MPLAFSECWFCLLVVGFSGYQQSTQDNHQLSCVWKHIEKKTNRATRNSSRTDPNLAPWLYLSIKLLRKFAPASFDGGFVVRFLSSSLFSGKPNRAKKKGTSTGNEVRCGASVFLVFFICVASRNGFVTHKMWELANSKLNENIWRSQCDSLHIIIMY